MRGTSTIIRFLFHNLESGVGWVWFVLWCLYACERSRSHVSASNNGGQVGHEIN
jgi:hypothetical protein